VDRIGQRGVERSVLSIISRSVVMMIIIGRLRPGSQVAESERPKGLMGFRIKQNDQRGQTQMKHGVGSARVE
jgi:hypothetical protein